MHTLASPSQLAKAEQLNFSANKMFKLEPAAAQGWNAVEVSARACGPEVTTG